MKRYIALLRGVNISGKNKVPMAELKKCFEALDFTEVKTCLNSGNVVFSCADADAAELTGRIERMIRHEFGLDIPVFIILQEELADTLLHAPDWWGTENKEIYNNLIFIMPPRHLQTFTARSARRRKAWNRYRNTKRPCSGRSAGRNIRKQTGGQGRPAPLSGRS